MAEGPATAEGELARTPLSHLLVYALDRRLTGALFLAPPPSMGGETVIRLDRGVPVKVRPGDDFALLGELLIEAGAIDRPTLDAALATKGLLGDVLILAGRVERDALEKVAREQFISRMVRLFALPPATTYRYYDADDALAEWGGDPACEDPLAILWAGIRIHGEVSALMESTLARLGDAPLRLHAAHSVSRFGLDAEESRLLDALNAAPTTLAQLGGLAFPGMARRFVYALAISRQLDVGGSSLPVGADVAPSSSQRSVPNAASLGRMALKSTLHRVGAAAPDAPGLGERVAPVARRSRERMGSDPLGLESSGIRDAVLGSDELGDGERRSSVPSPPSSRRGPDSGVVPIDAVREVRASARPPAGDAAEETPITMRTPSDVPVAMGETPKPPAQPVAMGETPKPPAAPAEAPAEVEPQAEENPLAALTPSELLWLANDCLAERDVAGAVEACAVGCKNAPDDADLAALHAWARSHEAGADLELLAATLDELLGKHEAHAEARFYRAMLRKRLGDAGACARDLLRVVEIAPAHEGALRELAALDEAAAAEKAQGKLQNR